jgi:hypothetical protein
MGLPRRAAARRSRLLSCRSGGSPAAPADVRRTFRECTREPGGQSPTWTRSLNRCPGAAAAAEVRVWGIGAVYRRREGWRQGVSGHAPAHVLASTLGHPVARVNLHVACADVCNVARPHFRAAVTKCLTFLFNFRKGPSGKSLGMTPSGWAAPGSRRVLLGRPAPQPRGESP